MWSIATFLLTNLGNRYDAVQRKILSELTLHWEGSLLLEKAFLILPNQVLILQLRRSVEPDGCGWDAQLSSPRWRTLLKLLSWISPLTATRWVSSRETFTRTQQPLPSFMVGNNLISWFLYDEIVERCEVRLK